MNKSQKELTHRTAVITGAAGTLCSVIAKDLAGKGMKVALVGRTQSKLDALASEIAAAGGSALAVAADVTRTDQVKAAAERIEAELGTCRILVNGAGGKLPGMVTSQTEFIPEELDNDPEVNGFFNLDMKTFHDEIALNLTSVAIVSQAFGRSMARAGGGTILNFASMTSYRPLSKVAPYVASKTGLVALTQWLSAYLAPAKIRVNAVAPGFFVNERSRKLLFNEDGSPSERGAQVLHHTPANRFGEARELLGTVNWLIDDEASGFVTGITVPVDGGFLACPGC